MDPGPIQSMLDRKPFIPFRIHVAEQVSYDITHPRMVLVTRGATIIGINRRDSDSQFFDEPVIVSNAAITRLEPLVDEVAT